MILHLVPLVRSLKMEAATLAIKICVMDSIDHGHSRRRAMNDLFMLGVMLGLFLLVTFLIELCAWLVRRH